MVIATIEKPASEYEVDQDKTPILEEEIFWSEASIHAGLPGEKGEGIILDMSKESWVWCFTGPKRAGKTSYMTYLAEKCAYLYDKRIISNYPIAFTIRYQDGTLRKFESEDMDIGKMLTQDADYRGCLLVLDEAPRTINRLATMTWKNRLLDMWLQQIGHDEISLLYASQNEELDRGWVDGALRFQTDILVRCRDASRRYPRAGYERGAMVLADLIDKSGQWTGYSYYERPRVFRRRILTKLIWNTFDTHEHIDVMESLARVKINAPTFEIGQGQAAMPPLAYLENAQSIIETVNGCFIETTRFYDMIGNLTDSHKKQLAHRMRAAGAKIGTGHAGGKIDFAKFDMEKFRGE